MVLTRALAHEPVETLSLGLARRIALAAQGFDRPRPDGAVDRRHVRRVFDRIGMIQIDSVNVVVRSQELPLWARLGPHRRDLLGTMAAKSDLFEYWAHEATLVPVEHHPLHRWQMERRTVSGVWGGLVELAERNPGYVEDVYQQVLARGPLRVSDLLDPGVNRGPWWGWSHGKHALEFLFATGRVSARRSPTFERIYDVTERIIPAAVLALPTPSEHEARRQLVMLAARSLGVGSLTDLADYPRLKPAATRPIVDELVEEGRLRPVQVTGWPKLAYLHPEAARPRALAPTALLSPFDSLVWFRDRNERLFDFHYRLELYTPAPKRIYGYYVLPFLHRGELVGRVDVKADRKAGRLVVPGAFAERGAAVGAVAGALGDELRAMAAWLGLDGVDVGERGDLAGPLRAVIRPRGRA